MQSLLKKKGFRLTKPRQYIIKTLTSRPATADELFERLKKKKVAIDLASVYRTLELFCRLGFTQSIEFGDGKKRYELKHENDHHHHVMCKTCGKIEDITFAERTLLKSIRAKTHYQIDSHSLEFFGKCAECRSHL